MENQKYKYKVAVLLACHNGISHIKYQVASILSQVDVDLTLFISDDFSNDGTYEYISNFNHNNIVILKQRRVFSPAQNFLNFFLDDLKCKFDFYAFSDQDDIWLPNKLIEAINCLKRNNANCYSSNLLVFHENDSKYKFSCLNKSSNQKEFDYLFQSASAGCTYVFDFSAYKILQEVISKYGVQKQIISHDWFVYAVCRSYRLNWIMDKKSYILYRQHNGNVYGSSNFISDLAKKIRIIRKKKYLNSFFSLRQYLCQSKGENEIFNAVISEKISDKIVLFLNFSKYRRKKIDAFVLLIILLFRKK